MQRECCADVVSDASAASGSRRAAAAAVPLRPPASRQRAGLPVGPWGGPSQLMLYVARPREIGWFF